MNVPIYILRLPDRWKLVVPRNRSDLSHPDFWERTVSRIVAKHFRISRSEILYLPYCQRRARVVGDNVYYGEKTSPRLLESIRKALGNDNLAFVYDDHEKRLKAEVLEFRRLVKEVSPGDERT